jgi:hypothetical protein
MGVFEFEKFAKGTNNVAKTLAECTAKGAITICYNADSDTKELRSGTTEAERQWEGHSAKELKVPSALSENKGTVDSY